MKTWKSIIGIVGMLTFVCSMGCVEKFEADISHLVTEGLVVEGDIVSDSTVIFQLSKMMPLTLTDEDSFDNYLDVSAELAVKGSDGSFIPGYCLGQGKYCVEIGTLHPEVEYFLEILYNGDTYQSTPQKPLPVIGIEEMNFYQPDLRGPVTVCLNTEEFNSDKSQYFLWYFEEDWEVHAKFQTTTLYDPIADCNIDYAYPPVAQGWCYHATDQILLGTTESIAGNQLIGKTIQTIQPTDHRLSVLYSIRVQQRNLTRMEYEYYQVRVKLSGEMGGLFTPQPSELPTNITCSNPTCKVIGYVGCNMGVSHYQLYIPEDEVFFIDNYNCEMGKAPGGSSLLKYMEGFQICEKTPMGVEWAKIGCVDVRTKLANPKGRPEWWPNPYLYYREELDFDE